MPFDGFTAYSIVNELSNKIIGGKINKIYQPESDEIVIQIHNQGKKYNVLLSANTNNPRIHLTNITKDNPQTPPMFCMLLRKNLNSASIIDVCQYQFDRIIQISMLTKNELGDNVVRTLIIEIMGRHSNIVLINKDSMVIIESIKRVGKNISSYREVLPGKIYKYPPQSKKNPLKYTGEEIKNEIQEYNQKKSIYKFLMDQFMGFSPAMVHEVCHRSHIISTEILENINDNSMNLLNKTISDLMFNLEDTLNACLYTNENKSKIYDFTAIEYTYYEAYEKTHYASISQLLEDYYRLKDNVSRIKQKSSAIMQSLQNKLERNYNKLNKQTEEYKAAENSHIFKLYGEILTSNIYKLEKGMSCTKLLNYYTGEEIEIPLSLQLTPSENAQSYYKKYNKGKRAMEFLKEQIAFTKEEIYYLESQIDNISKCTELKEFNEIKDELIENGYISGSSGRKNKKQKDEISKPLHYIFNNTDIYVGKNNKQNEYLTLKFASKDDTWLHVKDIPGSHVIIKINPDKINEETLQKASLLAAYYSKGKNSENVPVDYTQVKYVKKPKGAKTGMVIYTDQKTLYVTPKEEDVLSIDID